MQKKTPNAQDTIALLQWTSLSISVKTFQAGRCSEPAVRFNRLYYRINSKACAKHVTN